MTVERDNAADGDPGRWVRPPRLATGENREASRLELFYDLAYVLVVAELALAFAKDLSWASASGNQELQEQEEDEKTDERHDLYIYGHLPLTLGVAAAGIGLEELVLHPDADLPTAGGWTAIAGVALCLIGAGIILAGAHQRLSALYPWPTAALVPLAAYGFLPISPLALAGLLALTTTVIAITGARLAAKA